MRLTIVGAGYVGLVTGIGLADAGHDVVCVDLDAEKVAGIAAGRLPLHEPGLDELLAGTTTFRASTDLAASVAESDAVMLCVGTPSGEDGAIDLTAVEAAATDVGAALAGHPGTPTVVVKSTVVPGTTESVVIPALEKASGRSAGVDLGVGVNPEFLTEGTAVADFCHPDRLVLGGDALAIAAMRDIYASFTGVPVVETNHGTAEMIKYASNVVLATAISLTNELANLGAAVGGVDTVEVMRGVHLSRYLTGAGGTAGLASFYEAGCGYGGSCLPKDVAALRARGRELGVDTRVLDAVERVNDAQPDVLLDLARDRIGSLRGRRVTVLGLAFKPDTDDVRRSPAFPLLRALLDEGAEVTAHDPLVGEAVLAGFDGVRHTHDLAAALEGAEVVLLVTRWDEYQAVPGLLARSGATPLVVDGRRVLDPASVTEYAGIGR